MTASSVHLPPLMPELLAKALSRYDDRPAVHLDGEVVTYRGYREAVSRFAQAYQAVGLHRGSLISMLSRNRPDVLYATLGDQHDVAVRQHGQPQARSPILAVH
jgi:fatty-acyl-CoA synthase